MEVSCKVPLWEYILRNASGPLLSALIVGVFATWIAIKAQDRRAAIDRAKQDYEADLKLRHELIGQMTEAASVLYIVEQDFWRKKRDSQRAEPERGDAREELDQQYRSSRVAGEVLERQLEAYFKTDEPRLRWHATMDLLTVRYFQVTDQAVPLKQNARQDNDYHSGLSEEELAQPSGLLKEYRLALPRATQAVLREPLRPNMG
jgi:hypothetical protein